MSNHSQTDEWKWARKMEKRTFYQRFNSEITKALQIVEHCWNPVLLIWRRWWRICFVDCSCDFQQDLCKLRTLNKLSFTIVHLSPCHESLPILPWNYLFILYSGSWVVHSKFLGVGKLIAPTQESKFNSHSFTILQELALSKRAWDLRHFCLIIWKDYQNNGSKKRTAIEMKKYASPPENEKLIFIYLD